MSSSVDFGDLSVSGRGVGVPSRTTPEGTLNVLIPNRISLCHNLIMFKLRLEVWSIIYEY